MNVTRAIKHLQRQGVRIQRVDNNSFNVMFTRCTTWWPYTSRELVKLAKSMSSYCDRSYKRNVKHYNNRKNRTATRAAIAHGRAGDLNDKKVAKGDDVWAWD